MISRIALVTAALIGGVPNLALADGMPAHMYKHGHRAATVAPKVINAWSGGWCTNGFGVADPWPFVQPYYGEIRDRLRDDWSCAPPLYVQWPDGRITYR